jgi:lysophospholipase L1-like esterase
MKTLASALLIPTMLALGASEGAVIDQMSDLSLFAQPKDKGTYEMVDGVSGKAIRFAFADGCSGMFFTGRAKGTPEWDQAAGFSFHVKGDGSAHTGGLQFIYGGDYSVRYTYAFPISGKEWTKITVPWRDLVSPLCHGAVTVDPKKGGQPSKLNSLSFGKWWFWQDYGAHSYVIDEIRLEPTIALDTVDYKPAGDPLARVKVKVAAGKPITVVTMGDSLTDAHHNSNVKTNWPTMLKDALKEQCKVDATIVNPAIGGTELRQGIIIIPRWAAQCPEPDLVTIEYGANDFGAGMKGDMFLESMNEAVERVRRVTKGKSDVLVFTTIPGLKNWTAYADLAEACRKVAQQQNAGLCDTESVFKANEGVKEQLYTDGAHLTAQGQKLVADAVLGSLQGK